MRITRDLFYSVIVVILLIIIMIQRACNGRKTVSTPTVKIVKVIVRDTIIDSIPKYVPVPFDTVGPTTKVEIPVTVYGNVDTAVIIKKYIDLSKAFYSKVVYKDQLKHQYGTVDLVDTVTENRIVSRQPSFNFIIPITTITKTVTVPEKKRTKWFIGPEFYGNTITPIDRFGAGLTIITKKDQLYGGSVLASPNNPFYYGFTTKFKIGKK